MATDSEKETYLREWLTNVLEDQVPNLKTRLQNLEAAVEDIKVEAEAFTGNMVEQATQGKIMQQEIGELKQGAEVNTQMNLQNEK